MGAKFDIRGTRITEGAENNNRTAKSGNILKCFKFSRPF